MIRPYLTNDALSHLARVRKGWLSLFISLLLTLSLSATAFAGDPMTVTVKELSDDFALRHVILMNPGDMGVLGLSGGEVVEVCRLDDSRKCTEVRVEYGAGVNEGVVMMDDFELNALGLDPEDEFTMEIIITDREYLDYDYFPLYPGFTWLIRGYETPGETYTVVKREGNVVTVRLEAVPYTLEKKKDLPPNISEVYYYIDTTGIWQDESGERAYILMFPIEVGRKWETYDTLMGMESQAEIVDIEFSINQRGKYYEDCVKVVLTGPFDLDNPEEPHTITIVFAPKVGFLYQEPGERWRFYEELVFERRWD